MDRQALLERKGEILYEARMDGSDTLDGLAGSIVYWQDVAYHAHEKRKEAERRIARLEAALVEERARALEAEHWRGFSLAYARGQLEDEGLLSPTAVKEGE
jgi:hypothetical protein